MKARTLAGAPADDPARALRDHCRGDLALSARIEPWMTDLCARPHLLLDAVERWGSPVNVIDLGPMADNIGELRGAADLDRFRVFFARKANKMLTFVDAARRWNTGVDVASAAELDQTLAAGVDPANIVVSAAIKPTGLLLAALDAGVVVVLDHGDEATRLDTMARDRGRRAPVALRLDPSEVTGRLSRFGAGASSWMQWLEHPRPGLDVRGLHFHLDGYDSGDRSKMLRAALACADTLRGRGHDCDFVDMGGGFPVRYLLHDDEWHAWWTHHRAALLGDAPPLTYDNNGLGLHAVDGRIVGRPNVYPFAHTATRAPWLQRVLDAPGVGGRSIRDDFRRTGLELRCEPGRSLVDGCGMTVARVEFAKRRADGEHLVGLSMNRTQCRTSTEEFMVDPILIPTGVDRSTDVTSGFLVGAYCTERELIMWRRLRFPAGIAPGDLVVFPNTAGYYMHFLESTSHQIPLAANLVWSGGALTRDAIDHLRLGDAR